MTRALGSFLAQVKRNLRSPVTRVRNKKKFFTQFCFEIIAHRFQHARGAFPPTHPVAWVASLQLVSNHAQQVCIEGQRAHSQSNQYRDGCAEA
jgi:hypothetical protein